MTTIFLPTAADEVGLIAAGSTYSVIGSSAMFSDATEAQAQTTWRDAGTFSNLYTLINVNTASTNSSVKFRTAGGNGNQTVTVTGSTTGEFTDSTHSDVVASGDKINYMMTQGSAGNLVPYVAGMQFAPTAIGDVINKFGATTAVTDSSVNTTYYWPLSGDLNLNTTEANVQFKNKTASTLQNLYVYVSANTLSVATVKSRKNTANGNLTITISSGATGIIEDTTNTDSLVSGDLINTALNSTVTTSFTVRNVAVGYLNTNDITHYICASTDSSGGAVAAAATRYFTASGYALPLGTEAQSQNKFGLAFTASNFEVWVMANSTTATSTYRTRVASGNGNQSVTYTSGVTGYAEDTTHTDAVGATQPFGYQVVAGATGTTIRASVLGIMATYPLVRIYDFAAFFMVG